MLFPELIYDDKPELKLNSIQLKACNDYKEKIKTGIYKFLPVKCVICGKTDFDEIAGKDRYGLPYKTFVCNNCGLVQSDARFDPTSAESFYNNEYPLIYFGKNLPYSDIFENQYERANLIYRFIKPFLPEGKPYAEIQILEVGCNAGGILQHFADRGFKVSGLEINKQAVSFIQEHTSLNVFQGSLESYIPDFQPDIIIYSHVLEHLNDPGEELELIGRILKKDGMLYVEVPGIKNIHQDYECNLMLYLQNAHVSHFSVVTLNNLLQKCGYEIIAANEFIRCLCRKSEIHHSVPANDKTDVIDYLKKAELMHRKYPLKLFSILSFPKLLLKRIMKSVGLYKAFFRLYHMR
jgi:SAM-dependent methyltransferase